MPFLRESYNGVSCQIRCLEVGILCNCMFGMCLVQVTESMSLISMKLILKCHGFTHKDGTWRNLQLDRDSLLTQLIPNVLGVFGIVFYRNLT